MRGDEVVGGDGGCAGAAARGAGDGEFGEGGHGGEDEGGFGRGGDGEAGEVQGAEVGEGAEEGQGAVLDAEVEGFDLGVALSDPGEDQLEEVARGRFVERVAGY